MLKLTALLQAPLKRNRPPFSSVVTHNPPDSANIERTCMAKQANSHDKETLERLGGVVEDSPFTEAQQRLDEKYHLDNDLPEKKPTVGDPYAAPQG